jgi:hypothetical protein
MGERLGKFGIRLAETRTTALFQLATELPAATLARTLGIHIGIVSVGALGLGGPRPPPD